MLNPKELMLGNWVYESERSQFPMKVVNIDKDMVYLDFDGNEGDWFDGRMEDICPIPLTEEILFNNGFSREDTIGGFSFYRKIINDDILLKLVLKGGAIRTFVLNDFKEIKYVHQLQNILTIAGIEMEFKI